MLQLNKYLKPGKTIRLFYHKGSGANRTMHIRAIVDKKNVIYRFWGNSKWEYDIIAVSDLETYNREEKLRNGS